MSTTYIIKPPRTNRRDAMLMAETLNASFARIHRPTGHNLRGGGITFRMVEDAGQDEQQLDVRTSPDATVRLTGQRSGRAHIHVARSQAALDKAIRRVRAADAESLAEIDGEIEEAKVQLRALRAKRADAAYAAWKRADKVPLREIVDLIRRR